MGAFVDGLRALKRGVEDKKRDDLAAQVDALVPKLRDALVVAVEAGSRAEVLVYRFGCPPGRAHGHVPVSRHVQVVGPGSVSDLLSVVKAARDRVDPLLHVREDAQCVLVWVDL